MARSRRASVPAGELHVYLTLGAEDAAALWEYARVRGLPDPKRALELIVAERNWDQPPF